MKKHRVVELREAGNTYSQIAVIMGMPSDQRLLIREIYKKEVARRKRVGLFTRGRKRLGRNLVAIGQRLAR